MNLHTDRLCYLEVSILFSEEGCSVLRHYASLVSSQGDGILGLFDGDVAVGCAVLLCANAPEGCIELTSLYVVEDYRLRGCGGLLLHEAMLWAEGLGKCGLTLRIVASHPLCDALTTMVRKRGFTPMQTAKITRCKLDGATHEKWNRVCTEMNQKLCGRLSRQGFLCCNLAQAPPALMEQLRQGGLFEQKYSPAPLINGMQGQLMPDCSYLAYKDNVPAAVTIVLRGGRKSAVFQLIAAAKDYQKTGAVLLPVTASIDQAFALGLDNLSYCVYDDNAGMKSLAGEMLVGLPEYEIEQCIFQCCF